MAIQSLEMHTAQPPLLFVQFFLFFFFVQQIAVFGNLYFLFIIFVVIFLVVVGNHAQMHRVCLLDFHLGFALRAAQDLAFFYFVFVHINFGGTLRAADHGSILHRFVGPAAPRSPLVAVERIIYFAV
jgi:hypothetical protein